MTQVLIIGASRGIGLGFVQQLCLSGVSVTATARHVEDLKVLHALGASALSLDVRLPEERERFLEKIEDQEFSTIVHVAGVYGPRTSALSSVDQKDLDLVMQTNLAPVLCMLPQLMQQLSSKEGRWISISSLMASISLTQDSSGWLYKVSKAALNMAIHSASKQYPDKIIVAMSPGWVKTDMGTNAAPLTVEQSVAQMLGTLERLTLKDTGRFLNYEGQELSW
jgi:short-subunit dehydrogenase